MLLLLLYVLKLFAKPLHMEDCHNFAVYSLEGFSSVTQVVEFSRSVFVPFLQLKKALLGPKQFANENPTT